MSRSKFKLTTEEQAADPLQEAAPRESDAALFGDADLPPAGRMVAHPIIIRNIWPDRTQPRKAVPLKIAGEWDGDPARVADVLEHWRQEAERVSGQAIDILKHLERPGEGAHNEAARNPEYVGFLALVNLAASIRRYGLANPITVFKDGTRFRIETGERRWLAYHLLYQALGESYASIPARKVEYDIWRQAAENTAREDLNAIGQARQLAKLLLDLHWETDGAAFQSYEELVLSGGCDRAYYAQVANGNVYRIPSGMGQRILDATAFPSLSVLSRYRTLLKPTDDDAFNDEIWIQADLEDWPEGRIRARVQEWNDEQALLAIKASVSAARGEAASDRATLPIGKVGDSPPHESDALDDDFQGVGHFHDLPLEDDEREFVDVGRRRSEPFPGQAAALAEKPHRIPDASLLAPESTQEVLRALYSLAAALGDDRAQTAIEELQAVTHGTVQRLAERLDAEMMHEILVQYEAAIETLLVRSQGHVGDLLEQMGDLWTKLRAED